MLVLGRAVKGQRLQTSGRVSLFELLQDVGAEGVIVNVALTVSVNLEVEVKKQDGETIGKGRWDKHSSHQVITIYA